jgi:hypothetical protein
VFEHSSEHFSTIANTLFSFRYWPLRGFKRQAKLLKNELERHVVVRKMLPVDEQRMPCQPKLSETDDQFCVDSSDFGSVSLDNGWGYRDVAVVLEYAFPLFGVFASEALRVACCVASL